MIEFDGLISDAAEKRFVNRSKEIAFKVTIFSLILFLPTIYLIYSRMNGKYLLWIYSIICVVLPLSTLIPRSKKTMNSLMPHRIVIENDIITCIAEKYVESKSLADVKKVQDFGDFYEFVFPFRKISEKFICQKNLISKGTLEDFENLFAGKIVQTSDMKNRKSGNRNQRHH